MPHTNHIKNLNRFSRQLIVLTAILSAFFFTSCSTTALKTKPGKAEPATTISAAKTLSSSEQKQYQQIITELSKGKLGKTKGLLKAFIKKRPDLAGPKTNLALIFYREDNIEKAKATATDALALNPKLPETYHLMGLIEKKLGNLKAAEDNYSKAIKYKSDYINAHYNLALLYDIYFQEIEKAVKHYRRYLELIDFKDQQTADWLEQLENSLKG